MIDFLNLLCCPQTKANLILHENYLISVDKTSRKKYRIENDIPVLLADESETLDMNSWEQIMEQHSEKLITK